MNVPADPPSPLDEIKVVAAILRGTDPVLANRLDRATHALDAARAPDAGLRAALDPERLAEAITKAIPVGYPIRDYVRATADGIAREYARAATRPAEDDCDHGRAAHTDKGCLHCDCRRTYDGSLATRPAEGAGARP